MRGILFDTTHSFDDLNLILSKVDIPPAEVKTNYVDIPGSDGTADLTEAHGKVTYYDRECVFTFTVYPGDNFEEKKREVSNLLNGKRCKITLDKDPDYFWQGRCFINEYLSNKNIHKIAVGATVAPYKLRLNTTKAIIPAGVQTLRTLYNERKEVAPTITNTAAATILFEGGTYTIEPGTHKVLDIMLKEGANKVIVTSGDAVIFEYQEGSL